MFQTINQLFLNDTFCISTIVTSAKPLFFGGELCSPPRYTYASSTSLALIHGYMIHEDSPLGWSKHGNGKPKRIQNLQVFAIPIFFATNFGKCT